MEFEEPAKKLLMLCLADSADKQTRVAVPGFERMLKWTGRSRSRVLAMLAELRDDGMIATKSAGRRGHTAEYWVLPRGCCLMHGALPSAVAKDSEEDPRIGSRGQDPKNGSGGQDPNLGSRGQDANSENGSYGQDPNGDLGSWIGSRKGSRPGRTPPVSSVSSSTTGGGVEDPDGHLDVAARLLTSFPPPWALGPKSSLSLVPAVAEALRGGWTADALTRYLTANGQDVRNPLGVLAHRLADLPAPPRPREPRRQVLCEDHGMPTPCTACAGDRVAADR